MDKISKILFFYCSKYIRYYQKKSIINKSNKTDIFNTSFEGNYKIEYDLYYIIKGTIPFILNIIILILFIFHSIHFFFSDYVRRKFNFFIVFNLHIFFLYYWIIRILLYNNILSKI